MPTDRPSMKIPSSFLWGDLPGLVYVEVSAGIETVPEEHAREGAEARAQAQHYGVCSYSERGENAAVRTDAPDWSVVWLFPNLAQANAWCEGHGYTVS